MNLRKWTLWICAGVLLVTLVQSAWGLVNNGFDTDYVYSILDFNSVEMVRESDGEYMGNLVPDGGWWSLTFSGGKAMNDARLYVAKVDATGTDIQIAEYDSAGQQVRSNMLSNILGHAVGPAVDFTTIRYGSKTDSLFLGVSTDTNNWVPAVAYEIDLNLSARLHTYQDGNVNMAYGVAVDVDPEGTLYMTHHSLGGSVFTGDLIAFNTAGRVVGGTTNAYTTLIDATTYVPPGDVNWFTGVPIYRGTNNPTGRPTILMLTRDPFGTGTTTVPEFYLNQKDANNNLVYRGHPITPSDAWAGQLDELTGQVWMGSYHPGTGIAGLWPNDATTSYFPEYSWGDADSPAPEPAGLIFFGLGLGLLGLRGRMRKH